MSVVVAVDDGAIGLLVDEIGDVLEVDEEPFEEPTETLQGELRALIRSAYKLDAGLLLELDTDEAIAIGDR